MDMKNNSTAGIFTLTLTQDLINQFLEALREKGVREGTLKTYRHHLEQLYDYLPEGKQIEQDTLAQWREELMRGGYAVRSANISISTANSLLDFCDKRHLQGRVEKPEPYVRPELSRGEYLRLLQTAKIMGDERAYLLIKVFACTGMTVQELVCLSVEAVQKKKVVIAPGGTRQLLHIPECLQAELLEYAQRNGILSGPIFLARTGLVIRRSNVARILKKICHHAQVAEEKGTSTCLRNLYQATIEGILGNIDLLVEQAHDRVIEKEQLTYGWEE